MDAPMTTQLTVAGAAAEDAGRGVGRIDPATLAALGGGTGALLAVTGRRTAYVRALPQRPNIRDQTKLQIDGATRGNAGAAIGDTVTVSLCDSAAVARKLQLTGPAGIGASVLCRVLTGVPLCAGDRFRLPLVNGREAELQILSLEPEGPGLVDETTVIEIAAPPKIAGGRRAPGRRPALRGSRRPRQGGRTRPRSRRVAAAQPRGIRASGNLPAQGRAAGGTTGNRQDDDRSGSRGRKPGAFPDHQRARDRRSLLRRI